MKKLRIAIDDTPQTRASSGRLLPNATPVFYKGKKELDSILATGAKDVDAMAAFSQEVAAWTIRYPNFTLVTPEPTLFLPTGYAVARGNNNLLLYLNTWLLNAKADGTIDELYRYWMLGQLKETQPPRWSVIRDVLGWID